MTFEQIASAITGNPVALAAVNAAISANGATPTQAAQVEKAASAYPVGEVQGVIRDGNTLHLQRKSGSSYERADVEVSSSQAQSITNQIAFGGSAVRTSLAGTSTRYLAGKLMSDGSVQLGGFTFKNVGL